MIGKTNSISGVSDPVPKIKTVSGSVISISDALAQLAESLVVGIEPVQSGSGDPSPSNVRPISGWSEVTVTRCGKNMSNIASIKRGDGSARTGNEFISLPAGTYTISANNVGNCSMSIQFWSSSNNMGTKAFNVGQDSYTITATDDIVRMYCYISTENYNNGKYGELTTIQIETGSSPTAYEPYNGNTYTIQLGQTVYGGSLDVTTGVLTVDRAQIASYAGETLPSTWISDRDVYSAGATPTTGAQVVYELATPQTIQLSPITVQMLLGNNTLWADSGDSELQYWARR